MRTTHGSCGRVLAQQGHQSWNLPELAGHGSRLAKKTNCRTRHEPSRLHFFQIDILRRRQPGRPSAAGWLLLSWPTNKHMIPRRFGVMMGGSGERGAAAQGLSHAGTPCRGTDGGRPNTPTRKLRAQRQSTHASHPSIRWPAGRQAIAGLLACWRV